MSILLAYRVFAPNLQWGSCRRNIFFLCLTCGLKHDLFLHLILFEMPKRLQFLVNDIQIATGKTLIIENMDVPLILKRINLWNCDIFIPCLCKTKSPCSSRYCVGLLHEKSGFEPQTRHQNKIQKVIFRRFPLSRFLAKTLRVNKIAMKSFSKNLSFAVDFKL